MKYYAVKRGRQSGVIVRSWDDCKKLVDGFSGAVYKSFTNEDVAADWLSEPIRARREPYRKGETLNQRFNRLNKCVMRKTYTDPFTGELYVNRCVMRKGPTIVGENYVPSNDTSVPW